MVHAKEEGGGGGGRKGGKGKERVEVVGGAKGKREGFKGRDERGGNGVREIVYAERKEEKERSVVKHKESKPQEIWSRVKVMKYQKKKKKVIAHVQYTKYDNYKKRKKVNNQN